MNKNRRAPLPQTRPGLVLCLVVAAVPSVSRAVEYSAQPSVSLQETYNDNIRLTRTTHDTVTGTILTPQLTLAARTDTWQVGTDLRWRAARYRGIDGLDANGRTVNLYSQFQSERNSLQIGGGRARDSILTGEIVDADTGLVKSQTFRITNSANASWSWSMTEKDQFNLSYQDADVSYQDSGVSGLFDYTQRGPTAVLTHQWSERTRLSLQASNSVFTAPELGQSHLGQYVFAFPDGSGVVRLYADPRELNVTSTTNSLQAGIDFLFSGTLKGGLLAGKHKTSSEFAVESCTGSSLPVLYILPNIYRATCLTTSTVTQTTENRGSIYSANLTKSFPTSTLSALAERAVDPSGSGTLVQRETLNLNLNWSRTERLIFLLSVRGDKFRALEGPTSTVDRNQYYVEPGLQWRLTEDSGLRLSYRYNYLKFLNETESADSNMVNLAFSRAWRKRSISR